MGLQVGDWCLVKFNGRDISVGRVRSLRREHQSDFKYSVDVYVHDQWLGYFAKETELTPITKEVADIMISTNKGYPNDKLKQLNC